MLHHKPPTPTKLKHIVYLCASTVLGVLLSIIVHVGVETQYILWSWSRGHMLHWYGSCALHPVIQVVLPIAGAVGGYFLGRFWWRIIYIEKRSWVPLNRLEVQQSKQTKTRKRVKSKKAK